MRPSFLIAGVMTVAAWAGPALAQGAVTPAQFATKASAANAFEIEASKLALDRAASPKVKAFARDMIADHTAAEKKLQTAASGSGADAAMALDAAQQAQVTELAGKTGLEFDNAYIADQIKAHKETLALLADYKNTGNFPKLKVWAAKTQPTVDAHLKAASALANMRQ